MGRHGAIIVTTRNRRAAKYFAPTGRHVEVKPLSDTEGAELLLKRLHEHRGITTQDQKAARKLAASLGGLPLALAQIAGLAHQRKLSLHRLWRSFHQHSEPLFSDDFFSDDLAPRSGYTIDSRWKYGYARLQPTTTGFTSGVLAFLDPDQTPLKLFQMLEGSDAIQDLDANMQALHDLSLIRFSHNDQTGTIIQIHSLVQETYRKFMDPITRSRCLIKAAQILSRYCCGKQDIPGFLRSRAIVVLESLKGFAEDDEDMDMLKSLPARAPVVPLYVQVHCQVLIWMMAHIVTEMLNHLHNPTQTAKALHRTKAVP
ncbi:hypothetical protein EJ03DRAFT_157008 [Teratosphaeria nubilosa]|uniref:Uncharacterized protein n=1 Tax=Teratosphaeria nubilosa TaxID=161662 RepID=A0A6G1L3U9_9PEZI|nr:hypothetical protein EJ03DRAFT_157008 [Teratosphaeria nubilosa]